MNTLLLDEYYFKLKLIGIFQIIGSAVSILVIGYMLSVFWPIRLHQMALTIFLFSALIICILSIYLSIGLIKRKPYAINASIIFQSFQIFSFSYLTYSFSFLCNFSLILIFRFSPKPNFDLDINFPTIEFYTNVEHYPSIINIHLIPVFLIIYMIRVKAKIKNEEFLSAFLKK